MNTKLSLPPEFEIGANLIEEKVNNIKQLFKDKLIEFDIITDEFEADNYVAGLCNLLVALTLLKQNDSLFESENCEQLYDELDKIFSNNKYAMGEIKKIIDNDIIPKLKNGDENVPINPVVYSLLHFVFENTEE